jgi:hypothetical protein
MATNIDDLPTNDKPNITMENIDKPVQYNPNVETTQEQQNQIQQSQLSQSDIDKIVSGIQKAGNQTELPIRDIPTNTQAQNITNDPNVQPNYIPNSNTEKYISEQTIFNNQNNSNNQINMDNYIDELQIPLIIILLFFFIQLPFINKILQKYMTFLFSNDGNITNSGLFIKSLFAGVLFYIINKGMAYMNNI